MKVERHNHISGERGLTKQIKTHLRRLTATYPTV